MFTTVYTFLGFNLFSGYLLYMDFFLTTVLKILLIISVYLSCFVYLKETCTIYMNEYKFQPVYFESCVILKRENLFQVKISPFFKYPTPII